jgi:bifunctional ADP-heptose synthase (sugar kinase/adenylyltransferase)
MLEEVMPKYDLVIVVDYGHGMLTDRAINLLADKAPFLAVNTQANAANKGFNTISRYPRADYICLARHEIELEERSRNRDIRDLILSMRRKVDCNNVVITLSKAGNISYSEAEAFVETPSLTEQVVDRMGAGDAVLALTSLCVAQRAPMAVVGFIGNVVGAQAVAVLGHKTSTDRTLLFKSIATLLK